MNLVGYVQFSNFTRGETETVSREVRAGRAVCANRAHVDFEEFFNRHWESTVRLLRSGFRSSLSKEQAEDAAQAAFVEIWEKARSGEVIDSPEALLHVIARRRGLNMIRGPREVALSDEHRDEQKDERRAHEIRDLSKLVLAAVQGLPRKQRYAVFGHAVGLTDKEIARWLESSVGAVRVNRHTGLRALEQSLGALWAEIAKDLRR